MIRRLPALLENERNRSCLIDDSIIHVLKCFGSGSVPALAITHKPCPYVGHFSSSAVMPFLANLLFTTQILPDKPKSTPATAHTHRAHVPRPALVETSGVHRSDIALMSWMWVEGSEARQRRREALAPPRPPVLSSRSPPELQAALEARRSDSVFGCRLPRMRANLPDVSAYDYFPSGSSQWRL